MALSLRLPRPQSEIRTNLLIFASLSVHGRSMFLPALAIQTHINIMILLVGCKYNINTENKNFANKRDRVLTKRYKRSPLAVSV